MPQMTRNTNTSDFEPCPVGQWPALLVDIVDHGYYEVTFEGRSQGLKPHCGFVWACYIDGEIDVEIGWHLLFDRRFKWSFDPKANLYKRLADWLGKDKLDAMLDANDDIESLILKPAYINVVHNASDNGNIYANVGSIMPLPKGLPVPALPADFYTRRQDRDDWEAKKPTFSAFEFLPPGVVIGVDGKPELNPHSNNAQAGAINGRAAAVNVNGPSTVTPNEPVAGPAVSQAKIKTSTLSKLLAIATAKFGPAGHLEKLNAWLGKDVDSLTNEEGLLKAIDLQNYTVPPSKDVDTEDDDDPFEDGNEAASLEAAAAAQ